MSSEGGLEAPHAGELESSIQLSAVPSNHLFNPPGKALNHNQRPKERA